MSAHVLLNLSNELEKRDKTRGLDSRAGRGILSFFSSYILPCNYQLSKSWFMKSNNLPHSDRYSNTDWQFDTDMILVKCIFQNRFP